MAHGGREHVNTRPTWTYTPPAAITTTAAATTPRGAAQPTQRTAHPCILSRVRRSRKGVNAGGRRVYWRVTSRSRASIGTGFRRASPYSRAAPSSKRVSCSSRAPSPGLPNTQAMGVAARAAAVTNPGQTNPAGVSHGTPTGAPPWATKASPPAAEEQSPVVLDRAPTSNLAKHGDVSTDVQGTPPV